MIFYNFRNCKGREIYRKTSKQKYLNWKPALIIMKGNSTGNRN